MQKSPNKSSTYTLRYWSIFTKTFLGRFKAPILMGLLIGVLIFLASRFIIPRIFDNKTEIIGLTGRHSPEELPNFILEDVSGGLTKLSADGLPEPGLASSWDTPDKGKTWIFKIKDGLVWQDGTPVKSSDINYQFTDVVIERPDDSTISFALNDPFSPFPSVLSRPVFKSGFLGTGEWKVTNIALTGTFVQTLILSRSDGSRKIFKFYPTEDRTKLAFKLGQVNSLVDVINPSSLDSWSTATVAESVKRSQIVTLFYNNEDPIFADNKELRQALNYAIDKDRLGGERAISPIPPSNWVYNPQVKPYNFSEVRARELIESAGVAGEEIKIVTSPVLLSVAEQITKDWESVGMKTILQISSVVPTDFQVYLTILDVPRDPDQYSIWHSTQKDSTNISKFANVRVDKLLEDGRLELDLEARRELYLDFQRFLVEELPASFLYHPVTYTITRK